MGLNDITSLSKKASSNIGSGITDSPGDTIKRLGLHALLPMSPLLTNSIYNTLNKINPNNTQPEATPQQMANLPQFGEQNTGQQNISQTVLDHAINNGGQVKAVATPDGHKVEFHAPQPLQTNASSNTPTGQDVKQIKQPKENVQTNQNIFEALRGATHNATTNNGMLSGTDIGNANLSNFLSTLAKGFIQKGSPAENLLNGLQQRNQSVLYRALKNQLKQNEEDSSLTPKATINSQDFAALPVEKQILAEQSVQNEKNAKFSNALKLAQTIKLMRPDKVAKVDTQVVQIPHGKNVEFRLVNKGTGESIPLFKGRKFYAKSGDGSGGKKLSASGLEGLKKFAAVTFGGIGDAILSLEYPNLEKSIRQIRYLANDNKVLDYGKIFSVLPKPLKAQMSEFLTQLSNAAENDGMTGATRVYNKLNKMFQITEMPTVKEIKALPKGSFFTAKNKSGLKFLGYIDENGKPRAIKYENKKGE